MATSPLLPRLISSMARPFEQKLGPDFCTLSDLTDQIAHIERVLKQYNLDFPFFVEIGSSPLPIDHDEYELWAFERIGWGRFQNELRLLYVLEGLPIPKMMDAEVVGVHCLSAPILEEAKVFEDHSPLEAEEVRAVPLAESTPEVKEGAYAFIPLFLTELSETISEMNQHHTAFESFIETKIGETVDQDGVGDNPERVQEISAYFRCERRQEFFDQFMDREAEGGS